MSPSALEEDVEERISDLADEDGVTWLSDGVRVKFYFF